MNTNWLIPLIEVLSNKPETINAYELRQDIDQHLYRLDSSDRQALLNTHVPDRTLNRQ